MTLSIWAVLFLLVMGYNLATTVNIISLVRDTLRREQ